MAELETRQRRSTAWLSSQFALPLHRNAYALVASGGLTSLFGLLYWAIAARRYSVPDLGIQSAVIAAMLFLAGVAQLGLVPVLIRFLPISGERARSLVARCYAASAVVAVAAAAVFVLGTKLWSPHLAFMRSSGNWWWAFLLATAATCISALQDGVLTGLRKAIWVPIENSLISVAKILFLVILAASLPRSGIFASWAIATVLAVIAVNGLIFTRLLRTPSGLATTLTDKELRLRQLVRPALHNQVANVFALAALNAMPLIVVFRLGPAPTAFFAIPWAIYAGLQQIASAMSFSLIVEAATTPAKLRSYFRRTLTHSFTVLAPAVAIVAVFAPQLLGLLGHQYAVHGTALLRWLAVASLPGAVLPMTLALARITHRTGIVMVMQATSSLALIVLSAALLPVMGITAVGVSALVTNAAVAILAGWKYLLPAVGRVGLPTGEAS